jgi:F-type H+-transporting ATPase subunit epsilon
MADQLHVELVSAERRVRSDDATIVVTRTVDGDIGVLFGHTPLVSLLADGVVRVEGGTEGTWTAAVSGGFISVAANRVSVLAERAVLTEDIDRAAAQRDLDEARRRLDAASADDAREDAQADVDRAAAWLRAAEQTGPS